MTSIRERGRSTGTPRRPAKAPADTYVYLFAAVAGEPSARLLARLPALPEGGQARAVALTNGVSLVVGDVPADAHTVRTARAEARRRRLGGREAAPRTTPPPKH